MREYIELIGRGLAGVGALVVVISLMTSVQAAIGAVLLTVMMAGVVSLAMAVAERR